MIGILKQRLIKDAKESRHTLDIEDMDHLIHHTTGQHAAKALVRDLRQCRLVLRVLKHTVEFRLLTPFLGSLQLACSLLQHRRKAQGCIQYPLVIDRRSQSRYHPLLCEKCLNIL